MKRVTVFLVVIFSLLVLGRAYGKTQWLKKFSFDHKDSLKEWKEKIFHGRVLYEIKSREDGQGYLLAKSDKSCSGLFYRISFSPKKHPYISWSWKADRFPSASIDKTTSLKSWIERDDYVLRVYVIFPAFIFTNTKCLEYVWAKDLPAGEILTSPFFKNIKLIALESGSENLGRWVQEERNIFNDYKLAFKSEPRLNVGAIAVMTDADNTQSRAEGSYADIKVGYHKAVISPAQYQPLGPSQRKAGLGLWEYLRGIFKAKEQER